MCGCQEVAGDDIDALLETIEQSNGLTLQSEGCGGSDNRPVLYVEHRWVGAQHNIRTLRGVTSSNQNTHHLWQSFISDRFDWDLPSFVCQEPESWDGVEEILWSSSSSWRSKVRSIQNSLSVGLLLLKVIVQGHLFILSSDLVRDRDSSIAAPGWPSLKTPGHASVAQVRPTLKLAHSAAAQNAESLVNTYYLCNISQKYFCGCKCN